ncbi:hypothetical protein GCM10010156_65940 [Planobispora rosea]|uniref:Uncharacterized protein n=1 Tax=Planobispora rosea TaxID=35762 RepID=A0A8J3SDX1_PLARO|nr:hypothetical protein [Planobispora rosea]GGS98639.1 hypothetical protein GCM10010156_65940 [Planobispora rosea]GIH87958.1 hypothetical protein Pro02_63660 [Planobispora rosea]
MENRSVYAVDLAEVTKDLTREEIDTCAELIDKLRVIRPHLSDDDISGVLISAAHYIALLEGHEPGVKLLMGLVCAMRGA